MKAALLLAAGLCAAEPGLSALKTKRFGVLLLGEGGAGSWAATVQDARKALGKDAPLEFAEGQADPRSIQRGIDALESQGVRLIVAVPLFLDSQSPVMDQTRFLLGLRERPSDAFLGGAHALAGGPPQRLNVRTPLVLAKALDDNALLVEVIAARARKLSSRPNDDTLILVGTPPSSKDDALRWAGLMSSLAEKAGRSAGFKAARAMALAAESDQDARERSERQIGQTLRKLRASGGVVVVPAELTPGAQRMALDRMLDGAFVRYDGQGLLPDPKFARWIKQAAEQASKLPDMRLYQKDRKSLTPPPALTFEHKLSIPSQGDHR